MILKLLNVLIIFLGFLQLLGAQVATQSPTPDEATDIQPPDVFVLVMQLRADIEAVRLHMGRPAIETAAIRVTDAAPREVYFQAQTLLQKTQRLCFEQTREIRTNSVIDELSVSEHIKPRDVYGVVQRARAELARVQEHLGLEQLDQRQKRNDQHQPTDVFNALSLLNRQMNTLLDQQFSDADVYRQVTKSMAYLERLLEQYPNIDSSIPRPDALVHNKTPADVCVELSKCHDLLKSIFRIQSIPMASVVGTDEEFAHMAAVSSDAYDYATFILSQSVYLFAVAEGLRPPHKTYVPGRKYPSDVCQRVGVLKKQLQALLTILDKE